MCMCVVISESDSDMEEDEVEKLAGIYNVNTCIVCYTCIHAYVYACVGTSCKRFFPTITPYT